MLIDGTGLVPCTNRYPAEVDGLEAAVRSYPAAARDLARELLVLADGALGIDPSRFLDTTADSPIGGGMAYELVPAGEHLRAQMAAIAVDKPARGPASSATAIVRHLRPRSML